MYVCFSLCLRAINNKAHVTLLPRQRTTTNNIQRV